MLRSDTFQPLPRVGAGTRSVRPTASRSARARGEAVEMQEKRFGYFPQRFRWHGESHVVEKVERCWTKMGRTAQLCFRVHTRQGVFDLTQDVKRNIWTVAVV